MEGKLDYKIVFFDILRVLVRKPLTREEEDWLWEKILPNLVDQTGAINFALEIAKDRTLKMRERALKFLFKKLGFNTEDEGVIYTIEDQLEEWSLEVLKQKLLESIPKKPEVAEEHKHGTGSEG